MHIVQINPEPTQYTELLGFFPIATSCTTSKFCNADCFPQNSKYIFGNKATALKRQ